MKNETFADSLETLNYFLSELKQEPITEKEARDWGIVGGEMNDELYVYAHDYASEQHTDKCEAKNAWRYEV